uniref:Cytochrome c oxidase subunit 2 n=1 Tax=Prosthiostomum siphunculus TaxID=983679 RepID=A0A0P0CJ70_9PLAT|nr:cytochrome c oxidase subunit II [Prosthiostomum siphunculus]ALI86959.1 cytochrome c oxidase subunit II [Prosthiostomum siphunculus]
MNNSASGFIYGINFQNSISPTMSETIKFHDQNILILIVIGCLVGGTILMLWLNSFSSLDFVDSKGLEFGWTILPVVILVSLAMPSLELLYYLEWPHNMEIIAEIKATGMQWYWHYELTLLSTGENFSFDSYMLNGEIEEDKSGFRLLEVDLPVIAPHLTVMDLNVTGGDVIHSFAIPTLGIKMDGVPGRLNKGNFLAQKVGSYYGQCSEICGANHSFMPINLEVMPRETFLKFFE